MTYIRKTIFHFFYKNSKISISNIDEDIQIFQKFPLTSITYLWMIMKLWDYILTNLNIQSGPEWKYDQMLYWRRAVYTESWRFFLALYVYKYRSKY